MLSMNKLMFQVGELKGHTGRVLQLCQSPDTSTLLSAGADETLRYEDFLSRVELLSGGF